MVKKLLSEFIRIRCWLLLALADPVETQARALLLDFGPTTVETADALKDPAHAIGALTNTEIAWNQITSDTQTLYWGDGSLATGVTLELGRSTATGPVGDDVIDFANDGYTVSALGRAVNGGIYSGTSPIKDGIFGGTGGTNNWALGLRIDGLPSGTYTIYVHGRNSNTAGLASLVFYATNGPSAPAHTFSTREATAVLANSSHPITNGFLQGENYGVLSVTLAEEESIYVSCEGTVATEMRGFFNVIEVVQSVPAFGARITLHPINQSALESANAVFIAGSAGTEPLLKQWRWNGINLVDGPNVSGANSHVLTLRNMTPAMAGDYAFFVSNALGAELSSNATLTVLPVLNTPQMSNIWNLLPGDRDYLGLGSTERGLAFNALTTNLLLVSRAPADPAVVVLDAQTGAEKHRLDVTGIPSSTRGVSLGLNTIGVAEDGAVYAASVTVSSTSPPFEIYRWLNDDPDVPPVKVFSGDPGEEVQANLAYADAIAVRGAGPGTQILVPPRNDTNVVLLRTLTGNDFQTEVPPVVIAVSGVPSGFAQLGIAFGPGTNTFWGKTVNSQLYLVQFDLTAMTGQLIHAYSTDATPLNLRAISTDKNQEFLAGIALDTSANVRLYEISDLAGGPVLRDQEVFATLNPNTTVGGTGTTAFGGNYVFALDSNNGIKAFLIDANYPPPLSSFSITSVVESDDAVRFTWPSVAGRSYQVQYRYDCAVDEWTDLGNPILATTTTTAFTHDTTGSASRFYRVQCR